MVNRVDAPRLAVVEVTAHRPGQREYHAKVQTLIQRIISDAQRAGWAVTRHAAADVGTSELLWATDAADAVVIAGGEDIHPRFYGNATGYPGETAHYPQADEGQVALVMRALERGTPLLGICRGLQVINVAVGGTLLQHIADDGVHKNIGVPIDLEALEHVDAPITGVQWHPEAPGAPAHQLPQLLRHLETQLAGLRVAA